MIGYAERNVFSRMAAGALKIADALVEGVGVGWGDALRCHELARAVQICLREAGYPRARIVDGRMGSIDHSWIVLPGCELQAGSDSAPILDVYAPGRLPQVQLIDASWVISADYVVGSERLDVRRDIVRQLVQEMTFSGRRADTDISACAERGSIGKAYHPNTLFRAMEDPATTAILLRLIEESAAPLAEVENRAGQFAQDSTGISTVTYDRWFDQKHGKLRAEHAWLKLHIMVGTLTHVVTGAKVSSEADCPVLPELLATTAKGFKVREVSADKAYLSKKNLEAIDRIGAVPFIPFKSNSIGMGSKSEPWRKMWCLFSLKSEEFRVHYHRRSNVESTMWMIKSKFGGAVRSKLPVAQVNEILAKLVCHNLACIVRAVHEFGIDVDLGGAAKAPTAPILTPVQP
jgi:transposase